MVLPARHKKEVDYDTSDKEPSLGPTATLKSQQKATGKLPEAEGVPTHVSASSTWPRGFFFFFSRSFHRKKPAYWPSQQHEPQPYEAVNNCMIISFSLYEILRTIVFRAPNPYTRAASVTGKITCEAHYPQRRCRDATAHLEINVFNSYPCSSRASSNQKGFKFEVASCLSGQIVYIKVL